MNKKLTSILLLVVLCGCFNSSIAETISVEPGSSIQEAINSAVDGDVIELQAGRYTGNINFRGKAISIRGVGKGSIIRGDGTQAVVTFNSGEGFFSLLDSVTITGGFRGGAVLIENSSPRVNRCWIIKNKAIGAGSGIFIFGVDANGQSAAFFNNVIAQNKTRSAKPGNIANAIHIENSSPSFINNSIIRNDRSAFFIAGTSSPRISNNIIAFNRGRTKRGKKTGAGITILNTFVASEFKIDHNLFFKNSIADVILDGTNFKDFDSFATANPLNLTINGNVMGDPSFTKLKKLRDLRLNEGSTAIDAGDPDLLLNDLDNSRNDIGATGGLFTNPDLL